MKPNSYFWNIESYWENCYKPSPSLHTYNDEATHTVLDFTPSENPVFFDEHKKGYTGLKNSSAIEKDGKIIFLVDNHNKVLTPFFRVFLKTQTPLTIIHIDAHRDNALYEKEKNTTKEIQRLQQYFSQNAFSQNDKNAMQKDMQTIENACRVSDYLDAGKKIGLIDSVHEYTQSFEFENYSIPTSPYVLNLDIDIFGEEGDVVDTQIKTETIANFWNNAEAICIATSPGFIEKELAEKLITFFTKKS